MDVFGHVLAVCSTFQTFNYEADGIRSAIIRYRTVHKHVHTVYIF